MKKTEYTKKLRSKDTKALYKMLKEEYDNLYKLRFSTKFRNLKDVTQINKVKKNIARIYTIINEKLNED